MKTDPANLVVQSDYDAITRDIFGTVFAILMILGFILWLLWPITNYSRYFNNIPLMVFVGFFVLVILFFVYSIRNSLKARTALTVLYTFRPHGFVCHRSGNEYSWEDFDPFRYEGRNATLHLPLKNQRGATIALLDSHLSRDTYRKLILHIKEYAPTHLTKKLIVPRG